MDKENTAEMLARDFERAAEQLRDENARVLDVSHESIAHERGITETIELEILWQDR